MIELTGHIDDNGVMLLPNRAELIQWSKDHIGKNIILSVKVNRRKRTNPQNSYYWGVVVPTIKRAMNSYGNDFSTEETHEFLKAQFNYKEVEAGDGHYLKVPESTTKLDTFHFGEYIDKITVFAAEMFGVEIPKPESQMSILLAHHDRESNSIIVQKG